MKVLKLGFRIETTGDGLHAAKQSQEFLGDKDFRYLHEAISAHRAGRKRPAWTSS